MPRTTRIKPITVIIFAKETAKKSEDLAEL
jgi:hypothetical protein